MPEVWPNVYFFSVGLEKVRRRLEIAREKLAERNALQRYFARKLLPFTQSMGFSVVGDHFYEPVPNLKSIRSNYRDEPRQLAGFPLSQSWAEGLEETVRPYAGEYLAGPAFQTYGIRNWFYSGWDAAYYYCLVRSWKPRAITEVGRGVSTRIAGIALDRNASEGHPGVITSIDPYFRGDIASGNTRIVRAELQQIGPSDRDALLGADIFFVDSSHVVKWGSDVVHLFQSWIPNVAVNALVHLHDIFTPYDYPADWFLKQRRFWNEQYLFESFAAFNDSFRIECPLYHLFRAGVLRQIADELNAPELSAARGSAIWLRRTR